MTSRAEYRIVLRQDNSDFRLTPKGRDVGLVSDERWKKFLFRREEYEKARLELERSLTPKETENILREYGFPCANTGLKIKDLIKRGIKIERIKEEFDAFIGVDRFITETVETDAKYEGYVEKSLEQIEKAKKLEEKVIPDDIDYLKMEGLRLEARQKLDKVRPKNLGQAERISGVSPADISVLMVYLKK